MKKKAEEFRKMKVINPYRSRSNVEIGRLVIVHFLKRQASHENLGI
jgi:hypothetical protein